MFFALTGLLAYARHCPTKKSLFSQTGFFA
nr:MAG TPA: hypothetical protein [Caudoviricetes sp.]